MCELREKLMLIFFLHEVCFKIRNLLFYFSWSFGVLLWEIETGGKPSITSVSSDYIFFIRYKSVVSVLGKLCMHLILLDCCLVGAVPYPEIETVDLLQSLKSGYRMKKPNGCSDVM